MLPVFVAALTLFAETPVAPAQTADKPDAVIELWQQDWTQNAAGDGTYHEHWKVRLNDPRAYGDYADPRISYDSAYQSVKLTTARTILPNGKALAPEPYARNEVSPYGAAGWPAFAGIRQMVLTMPGLEPGCTVELEYQIDSKPGDRRNVVREVRLDSRYPIGERVVSVTRPKGPATGTLAESTAAKELLAQKKCQSSQEEKSGLLTMTWRAKDLAPAQDEPQAPDWHARRPWLAFCATGTLAGAIEDELQAIAKASDESPLLSKLAAEWTKGAVSPSEKVRALQEKLAATFNFVHFAADLQPAPRNASQVVNDGYGLPAEASAALISLAKAAGVTTVPALLRKDYADGADAAPTFAVAILEANSADAPPRGIWSAQWGEAARSTRWNNCIVDVFKVGRYSLAAWDRADESACDAAGTVTLAADGSYTAKLNLRASGLFVSPTGLRTTDQQRARVAELAARLVPGAQVTQFSVRNLSGDTFEADVEIKSTKPLTLTDGVYRFELPQDGLTLAEVPLPLSPAPRELPVELTGAIRSHVELSINWPTTWSVESKPAGVQKASGEWGLVEQTVAPGDGSVTLKRGLQLNQRILPAEGLLALRGPLNEMRGYRARTLLLKP